MKLCLKCKKSFELKEFYAHPRTKDGYLNKCKSCCKQDSRERLNILKKNPEFREKEKLRSREKGRRLNKKIIPYEVKKEFINSYKEKYPEKLEAAKKSKHLKKDEGFHLHHWSYNEEHYVDVIKLLIDNHYKIHRYMIYDQERKMYRSLDGILLDTKESHLEYIESLKNKL